MGTTIQQLLEIIQLWRYAGSGTKWHFKRIIQWCDTDSLWIG